MASRKNQKRIEPQFGGPRRPSAAPLCGRVSSVAEPRRALARRQSAEAERRAQGARRRRRERRKRSLLGRFFRGIVYWGFVLCIWVGIAGAGLVAYFAAELPGASEWRVPDRPPNIQILAVDGSADRQSRRHRRRIGARSPSFRLMCRTRSSPSRTAASARISASTRSGLSRALSKNFFAGGVVEGGSTLTQQLAKNMFLTPERSLKRKVQEVILSLWLETKYSKDQILEMYLNRVYFGSGAYGIDAAATRYFNVDARDLTLVAGGDPRRRASGAEPLRAEPQSGSRAPARLARARGDDAERLRHRRRGEECARQSRRRPSPTT